MVLPTTGELDGGALAAPGESEGSMLPTTGLCVGNRNVSGSQPPESFALYSHFFPSTVVPSLSFSSSLLSSSCSKVVHNDGSSARSSLALNVLS